MRCSIWRFESPRQYAPAVCVSLKCLRRDVSGTCGPRQRSMNGPSVYVEMTSSSPSSDEALELERIVDEALLRLARDSPRRARTDTSRPTTFRISFSNAARSSGVNGSATSKS